MHDDNRTTYLNDKRDWTAPQVLETDSSSQRTLLLMRDSFSTELIPLLKLHFRRIIVVHVQDGFCRKDLIERYRQDTIVVEVIRTSLGDE